MVETNKEFVVNLGKNLKRIRKEKGLSQHQLATNCEVDRAKISQIENGKEDFLFTTFLELAKGLGIQPKELLEF